MDKTEENIKKVLKSEIPTNFCIFLDIKVTYCAHCSLSLFLSLDIIKLKIYHDQIMNSDSEDLK